MKPVGVGIIGTKFIAEIHAESLRHLPSAALVAVASPSEGSAEAFAAKHGVAKAFRDWRRLLEVPEVEVVILALPNRFHAEVAIEAARAGKRIICEKPLCMNLEEADRMIEAARRAGVRLMYAEELCFAPKYVRAKQLVDEGALGKVYLVKQSEKHGGPHMPWFWDVEESGGGVLMDMGCHGIEFARWILGRPRIRSVLAHCGTYVHGAKTRGDDNAVLILEFEGGAFAIVEESWSREGGMDDRAEIHGSLGATYADLLHGNALETFSLAGYGYAMEKAPLTRGWSFTGYEEAWNYGFPQEMAHFLECVRTGAPPAVTGEDGRAVLEVLFAAYASAGTGRRIDLPFPSDAKKPIDLWKPDLEL